MLTTIKERASGWIAWALVILISIPFALWGINSYFEGASKVAVASVNGVDLDESVYQQALSEQRRALVQIMGRNVDAEYFASTPFKLQVLESLIDSNLQAEYLRERGYRLTDEQLSKRIASFEAFRTDGVFDPLRYEQLVQNAGLSVEVFEGQQRQQGVVDQLRTGLQASALVVSPMTRRAIELLFQKRQAQYVVIPLAEFRDSVSISDEAVRQEFEANRDQYVQPEQMQVDFIRLSVDELARQTSVNEEDIRAFYDANTDRFSRPGSRKASHILLTVPADADEAAIEAAGKEAAQLTTRARAGEDFGALAREFSKDPGSAARGGDLGIIRPGTMVPEFESAVFALAAGQISDPVRTTYGWHVIKLTELKQSEASPFEEVHYEIKALLERESGEARFLSLAEDFQNLVFEQPGSLTSASDFLGIPIQRSDWFSQQSGDGIAASEAVREAAFSQEVRVDRLNSEMLEIGNDTLVAVHFADFRDKRQQAFDEVRDQIRKQLVERAAREAQERSAQELIAGLRSGANWQETLRAADLLGSELPENLEDLATASDRVIAAAIYSAPAPVAGEPAFGGARLNQSEYLLYKLDAVIPGNVDQISEDERDEVKSVIEARVGDELYSGVSRALRTSADVKIFEENL